MKIRLGFVLVALLGCEQIGVSTGPPPAAPAAEPSLPTILDRGIAMSPCRGDAIFPDLSGGWGFFVETRDTRVGPDNVEQVEVSSRYGVARLCQDADQLTAQMLLCTYHQSPVRHSDGQCAAYLPRESLLAVLPGQTMEGTFDRLGLGAELTLGGWDESWGYTHPSDDDVYDHDGDGESGATLVSDIASETVHHVRRNTRLNMVFTVMDETVLEGTVTHTLDERRLGPPETLDDALSRTPQPGAVRLVRADGRGGSPNLDFDGDGVVRCAELGPFVGRVLPNPADGGACTR